MRAGPRKAGSGATKFSGAITRAADLPIRRRRDSIEFLESRVLLSGYALTSIANFGLGALPNSQLVADASGNLYGTTYLGGAYGYGTVFKIASQTGTVQTVASFNHTNGAYPNGVTLDGNGNLYGTAGGGGAYDDGTVFRIPKDNSTIQTLAAFSGANGCSPVGGVVLDGSGNLYGSTFLGGLGYGTVFEILSGSGALQTLASFNNTDGANPNGVTLDADGNLYGTTYHGGLIGYGTVFRLARNSSAIQALASFNGSNGGTPEAGVALDGGGNLYGTTYGGGASDLGTVFRIRSGTVGIETLASFDGSNGAHPSAPVTLDAQGNVYGSTRAGSSDNGLLFEIPRDSGSIRTVASFNYTNGSAPNAVTLDSAGNLYGTTHFGGPYGLGTVFKIIGTAGTIQTLTAFNGSAGAIPYGGITLDSDGNLFGTTCTGGPQDDGTVFEIARSTEAVQPVASFDGVNGAKPYAGVTLDASGNMYGTTYGGGTSDLGTVFEIARGSHVIQTVASFDGSNGASPMGGVTLNGSGSLYGTTSQGGAYGHGTIFEITRGTGSIRTLASFTDASAWSGVTLDTGGNLFGTTFFGGLYGGPYSYGTVFELARGSSAIQTIASFDGNNGAHPQAGVTIDASGNVYGTTLGGGPAGAGTVFEIASGTSAIRTLASFNRTNGYGPAGGVILDSNGNLFGTTQRGGTSDLGTVFELVHSTGTIRTLSSFDGTHGAIPWGNITLDPAGNLYGTTTHGGSVDLGSVFKLTPPVPGDVNGDRSVNFADLLILSQHYGRPATPDQGDLDEDGTVGFDDLLTLAQNYRRYEPAGWASPAAIPATNSCQSSDAVPVRRRTRATQRHRKAALTRLPGSGDLELALSTVSATNSYRD